MGETLAGRSTLSLPGGTPPPLEGGQALLLVAVRHIVPKGSLGKLVGLGQEARKHSSFFNSGDESKDDVAHLLVLHLDPKSLALRSGRLVPDPLVHRRPDPEARGKMLPHEPRQV